VEVVEDERIPLLVRQRYSVIVIIIDRKREVASERGHHRRWLARIAGHDVHQQCQQGVSAGHRMMALQHLPDCCLSIRFSSFG
jgi:hypothetical protein